MSVKNKLIFFGSMFVVLSLQAAFQYSPRPSFVGPETAQRLGSQVSAPRISRSANPSVSFQSQVRQKTGAQDRASIKAELDKAVQRRDVRDVQRLIRRWVEDADTAKKESLIQYFAQELLQAEQMPRVNVRLMQIKQENQKLVAQNEQLKKELEQSKEKQKQVDDMVDTSQEQPPADMTLEKAWRLLTKAEEKAEKESKTIQKLRKQHTDLPELETLKENAIKEFGETAFTKMSEGKVLSLQDIDPQAQFFRMIGSIRIDPASGKLRLQTMPDQPREQLSPEQELMQARLRLAQLNKENESLKQQMQTSIPTEQKQQGDQESLRPEITMAQLPRDEQKEAVPSEETIRLRQQVAQLQQELQQVRFARGGACATIQDRLNKIANVFTKAGTLQVLFTPYQLFKAFIEPIMTGNNWTDTNALRLIDEYNRPG